MQDTDFSPTQQLNTEALTFWLQMELELDDIVQVDPSAQRCPMCCSTLQESSDDDLLRCPNCGTELWL